MAARSSSFTPRDAGLLIILALMWGNSFLFVKTAVASIPPGWIVGGRLVIGASLLVAICAARRQSLPRTRRTWLVLGGIGVVGTGLPWFAQAWAQQALDSGLVAVLNATTPAATLMLALAFGIERLHLMRVIGLTVAITGSLIVIGGEISGGGPVVSLAVAVLAPFGYGLGSVLTRRHVSGRIAPLPAAAAQLLGGAIVLNVLALAVEGPAPGVDTLELVPALALLALGVFGTGLAFVVYFTLIERVGATNASMVTYLVPIVGLIAGSVVRGEQFGPNVFVGAGVLIVGIYLAQRQPAPDPAGGQTGDRTGERASPPTELEPSRPAASA
ncbi:DMT family transporter [soil metagenome]